MLGMAPVAPLATQAANGVFIDAPPIADLDYAPPSVAGSSDPDVQAEPLDAQMPYSLNG